MKDFLTYHWALMRANMLSYAPEKKRLFIMSFFMMVQNAMFFVLWGIFFGSVSEVKGWQLEDVARMYGIVAFSVGASLFFFNGVRSIAYRINDGTLDGFITKPRAVLPALLMSSSLPASIGDMAFAPIVWITFGNLAWGEVPLLLFVSLISVVIFLSMTIIIFSAAFWLKGQTRFSEQLFEMLIISSSMILRGQPFGVRLVIFTILPAGFITYLPTQLVRDYDGVTMAVLLAAALFYAGLATLIFKAGLRRYSHSL